MIAMLQGKVEEIAGHRATLNVQGVGYEVICSRRCLDRLQLGSEAKVIVFTDVKQDSIRLYGFDDVLERQVFVMLTQVQGVGGKSAAEIVSHIDKKELLRAIGAGDEARLQSIKGVGKKTAQRIVVELKDRVAEFTVDHSAREVAGTESASEDAIQALQALGFARKEAEHAVSLVEAKAPSACKDSGSIVREALRFV